MTVSTTLKIKNNDTFKFTDLASVYNSPSSVFTSNDLPSWLSINEFDNSINGIPNDLGKEEFIVHKKNLANFKLDSVVTGEVSGDDFGKAVSMNKEGSIMAIGASGKDIGPWEGYVRIFQYREIDESLWDQCNTMSSCSVDGVPILINDGDSAPINGKKYWIQLGDDINASSPGDNFGYTFKLSEDGYTVVVSSFSNGSNQSGYGNVKVYQYKSNWVQIGRTIQALAADFESGVSLAINAHGTVLAIGSYYHEGEQMYSGNVRVFNYINNDWKRLGTNIACEEKGHESGYSISMNKEGTRIAIAIYKETNELGSIYVYEWGDKLENPSWIQLGGNLSIETSWSYTVYSIAMSDDGSLLAICAYGKDDKWKGYVRVYEYREIKSSEWDSKWINNYPLVIQDGDTLLNENKKYWIQFGNAILDENDNNDFEYSVCMNECGSRLAVSSFNIAGKTQFGEIKMYKFYDEKWLQIGQPIKIDNIYDNFNKSIGFSSDGTKLMFGTYDEDDRGSINVFSLIDDSDGDTYKFTIEIEEGEQTTENDKEEINRELMKNEDLNSLHIREELRKEEERLELERLQAARKEEERLLLLRLQRKEAERLQAVRKEAERMEAAKKEEEKSEAQKTPLKKKEPEKKGTMSFANVRRGSAQRFGYVTMLYTKQNKEAHEKELHTKKVYSKMNP